MRCVTRSRVELPRKNAAEMNYGYLLCVGLCAFEDEGYRLDRCMHGCKVDNDHVHSTCITAGLFDSAFDVDFYCRMLQE